MNVPCSVCPGATALVSFPSKRRLLFFPAYATPVCGSRFDVVVRSTRVPPKYQSRSFRIGPPATASYVGDSLLARVVPFCRSNGVSALHAEFARFVRNDPENRLPPLCVTTFTTPPARRPYSA